LLTNLIYLLAALVAVVVIVIVSPNTALTVPLCLILIALMAVVATLNRSTPDLVSVLHAVTDLVRGRPRP